MRKRILSSTFTKGFTLIELLVVIAVIGVLAGAIIVAINPTEQLARSRDTAKKSTISQLADAVNAYYAANSGIMPVASAGWISTLVNSGDFKVLPAIASSVCTSTGNATAQQGFCYITQGSSSNFAVFAALDSISERAKCAITPTATSAFYLYSSADAKSGTVCSAGGGTQPNVTGGYTFF